MPFSFALPQALSLCPFSFALPRPYPPAPFPLPDSEAYNCPDHLATLAEEVAGLFANRDNPHLFLVHDFNFHRDVADTASNPIVGARKGERAAPRRRRPS